MLNPNEFDFQERLLSGAAFAEMNSKSFKSLPTIWELGSCDGILSSKIPENIPVYVLFIPHCAQVNDFYYQNMKSLGANFIDHNKFQIIDYPFYSKAKKEFEKDKRITFLNVLTQFKKYDNEDNRLYFENDPHLNDNGHQVLSDFILENIKY